MKRDIYTSKETRKRDIYTYEREIYTSEETYKRDPLRPIKVTNVSYLSYGETNIGSPSLFAVKRDLHIRKANYTYEKRPIKETN